MSVGLEHDDKKEQNHDRAGVNEHLHRREKESVQQNKRPRHRSDR